MSDSEHEAFDPELLSEGDEIAARFYREPTGFNLEMEAFCKKIWKPWFDAGKWIWIDLTQPETVGLQVDAKSWAPEVKNDFKRYLGSLKFPHDFDIERGPESWLCDYKFIPKTPNGIYVRKNDYDKYFRLGLPNFLVFIWANDRKKRYFLWVKREPSEYEEPSELSGYYDVSRDCAEAPSYDIPIKSYPKSLIDYWAWRSKLNAFASRGLYPREIEVTKQDRKRAMAKVRKLGLHEGLEVPLRYGWKFEDAYEGLRNDMRVWRVSEESPSKLSRGSMIRLNRLELRRKAIDRIMDGYIKALEPRKPHKNLEKVSILGFDTEFSEDRLLSVQLALLDGGGELKSKCIRENLEGYDAKRLLKDAIGFMMECDVAPCSRIFLIAHFAVADLGQMANCLRDFKFREINRAMHSEFVVPEEDEKELVADDVEIGDFKLKVIDLFAYYQSSLAKIGEWIGLPKLEVDRAHILDLYNRDPEKFRKYAVRDAEIALKAFVELRDFLWKTYRVEILKSPSIASTAGNIFRINYLNADNIPAPVASYFDYKPYRTKKGEWSTRLVKESRFAGDIRLRDLALQCYWGGRAECYVHGYLKGKFKLYDVSSLYPSCAMLQPLPNRDTQWVEITRENFTDKSLEGFVLVEFEFPEGTRYPCLPVHGALRDMLYFPLEGISYCTISEIREAQRLGCKIKQIYGFGFKPSESEINHVLASFMRDMLKLKVESQKGSVAYENYKLIMNALIGKLAQRNPEDNMDYAQELFTQHGVPMEKAKRGRKVERAGSLWAPEWASLILGRARALMSQFINKGALMTVTDSVLLPKRASIECEALTLLRSVGSDLIAEPFEVASALIIRAKLYALVDSKGEISKEAHHAVHLGSEQCKKIFQKALQLGGEPDVKGERAHIIRLREALQKGKPLGSSELKPSRIYFRWDWKRTLDNPAINMFRESSNTKPIRNVVEHESDYFALMKRQRARSRGRHKEYSSEIIEQVALLKNEGKTYREIAKTLNISLGKAQRIIKLIFLENK